MMEAKVDFAVAEEEAEAVAEDARAAVDVEAKTQVTKPENACDPPRLVITMF
jgi:hypothetical protein